MEIIITIAIVFTFVFVSLIQSILMLSANDYVNEHEISIRKKTYFRYCVSSFKKLVKSILSNKYKELHALSFFVNYLIFIIMISSISVLVLESINIYIVEKEVIHYIRKYLLLILLIFTFLARTIGHISNRSEVDINKLLIKSFSSVGIIFLNYSYTLYFLQESKHYNNSEVVIKIILFFNTLLSIYIFDSFSKYKKKNSTYSLKAFDTMNLYFLLMSVFVFLNMNTQAESVYRYIYYSISILLVEFMVSYIKKIVGYSKLKQNIKFIYEYLMAYYVIIFLGLIGLKYVV